MDIYNNWSYLLGFILIIFFLVYTYISVFKRHKTPNISNIATIGIILFSIPRLLHILYVISFSHVTSDLIESYKIEITLGILLLISISIQEFLKLCNMNKRKNNKHIDNK